MAGPDPFAIWLGDAEPGQINVTFERPWNGNLKARKARALAILRNLQRGDWLCRECGIEVALHKRSDAVFCSDGCRKRAARRRRHRGAQMTRKPYRGLS